MAVATTSSKASGKLRPEIGEARRRLVQVGEHDRELAVTLERALTHEALEQDTAERVDVCTTVDRVAPDLLGWNVI